MFSLLLEDLYFLLLFIIVSSCDYMFNVINPIKSHGKLTISCYETCTNCIFISNGIESPDRSLFGVQGHYQTLYILLISDVFACLLLC